MFVVSLLTSVRCGHDARSMWRTNSALICLRTGGLNAAQRLPRLRKMDREVRYPGIELGDSHGDKNVARAEKGLLASFDLRSIK